MPNVTAIGITIHFTERGQGDPLILPMGLGAPGSRWEDHLAAYEQQFRCILVDNRGAGTIDFPRIVTRLRDTGYDGWIMIEEESVEAEADPDAATTKNGDYLRKSLLPLV